MSNRDRGSENSSIRATSAATSRGKESRLVVKTQQEIKTSTPTPRVSKNLIRSDQIPRGDGPPGGGNPMTHERHQVANHVATSRGPNHAPPAKDSNPKFEFLNDSAWNRRNIEAFYLKNS